MQRIGRFAWNTWYSWCRNHPWMLLLYSIIIFVGIRNREDTLEVLLGNKRGPLGLGLSVLTMLRWSSMLLLVLLIIMIQLEDLWLPFWTQMIPLLQRIGEGTGISLKITANGFQVDILPRHIQQAYIQPIQQQAQQQAQQPPIEEQAEELPP